MTFPQVTELLPHAPPMVLLDEILSFEDDTARCSVTIEPDGLFVEDRRVRAVVALEFMAQCVGVCTSLRARTRAEPLAEGYLVGARELRYMTQYLFVGDILEVEATLVFDGRELGSFDCSLKRRGELIATGLLNVYRKGPHKEDGA